MPIATQRERSVVGRPADELEALIREARERQRHRRRRFAAAVVLLAAAALAYGGDRLTTRGGPGVERVAGGPVVNVAAFAHHGRLAFVSRNVLWVLDGTRGSLRRLPAPPGYVVPQSPMLSPDGRWLAYLERSPNGVPPPQLWIARGDGSGARRVRGVSNVIPVGWNPHRDLLAVAAGPAHTKRPCPCYTQTTLRLVAPDGSSRVLARAAWVHGAAWSPDGSALVASTDDTAYVSRLVVYPVMGGMPRTWLTRTRQQRLNGMTEVLLSPAGWWPGWGVGFWVFGDGAVHNNDATPLDVVAGPGAHPRLLGQTLSDGITGVIAASATGRLAIVTDHGGGRAAWQDKRVEVCDRATASCRELVAGTSHLTGDPAWSPDGRTLAFIEGPNVTRGPWTQGRIAAWHRAHRVWLYDATTGRRRELPAAHGAAALAWSPDGTSLLYVRENGLWLLPELTGKPVEIAAPLFRAGSWPQYFAQIAWTAQFSWWPG